MTYIKRWRKCHAYVRTLVESESDTDSDRGQQAALHSIHIDEPTDLNSPGYDSSSPSPSQSDVLIVSSSDSEEELDASEELSETESDADLCQELAAWATRNHCTRSSLNDLLNILRKQGQKLPKDARTLLETPRAIEIENKCGGQYTYFGIEKGLRSILSNQAHVEEDKVISLKINIDGIPLFKSNNVQFWPILCTFDRHDPFIVALFHGVAKPQPLDDFLQDFLIELNLLKANGIGAHEVTVKAFICDAPARAFVKCIKGHTGFSACERCTITGYTKENRRVFYTEEPCEKRTDRGFQRRIYTDHQVGVSPLVDFGISCVSSFCLDYMHLVCLGVVKRIIYFLKQGPRVCRLSNTQLSGISAQLVSFAGKIPSDFARQPRSIFEFGRWKATELRQFVLYTGPIVLKTFLPKRTYEHFLLLTVAISLLLDSDDCKRSYYLAYARELLLTFVNNSKDIYSDVFVSYNVHSLLHLPDDVENFQCSLNDISAFPFENHLQTVKRLVRNAKNPITQVAKRLTEIENSGRLKSEARTTIISAKKKDCCFILKNEDFAFIKEERPNGKLLCDVFKQINMENFFDSPCESKTLNIAYLKNSSTASRKLLRRAELQRKVLHLPYQGGFLLFPLLHEVEKHGYVFVSILHMYDVMVLFICTQDVVPCSVEGEEIGGGRGHTNQVD